jgi:hypothetical protein
MEEGVAYSLPALELEHSEDSGTVLAALLNGQGCDDARTGSRNSSTVLSKISMLSDGIRVKGGRRGRHKYIPALLFIKLITHALREFGKHNFMGVAIVNPSLSEDVVVHE